MNDNNYITTLPKRDLKTSSYKMNMNKKDLKKLSKSQLIKLLLKQEKNGQAQKQIANEFENSLVSPPKQEESLPRQSVNEYEPPEQSRGRPPKPTRKPPPPPSPMIKELNRALKGHTKSYGIELQDNLNPLNHFTKTKVSVESHLKDLLKTMKGFKFITTLEVTFKKDTINSKTRQRESIYKTAFFNGKAKTITKDSDTEHKLSMARQEIHNTIDISVSEGSGWTIDRVKSNY